jgi:cytoskeletal protein CcmA (bactofilin family)
MPPIPQNLPSPPPQGNNIQVFTVIFFGVWIVFAIFEILFFKHTHKLKFLTMFGNKDTKVRSNEAPSSSINIIGVGTEINGDVSSNGDIRIDGNITGTIVSKAKVVIGPQSIVKGDIEAQNADISGIVTGKIRVTETLYLKGTARIHGDVTVNKLVVETGAEFNGNCSMISSKHAPLTANSMQQNGKTTPKAVKAEIES